MSVELQQILSLVSFIMAGVMFAAAVVLFFVLKVPNLIGYLTGKNRAKAISRIRGQNLEHTDGLSGKLRTSASGNLAKTEKISTSRIDAAKNETTVLSDAQTEVLSPETTILSEQTTLLNSQQNTADIGQSVGQQINSGAFIFNILYEINYTDSKEIIQ